MVTMMMVTMSFVNDDNDHSPENKMDVKMDATILDKSKHLFQTHLPHGPFPRVQLRRWKTSQLRGAV